MVQMYIDNEFFERMCCRGKMLGATGQKFTSEQNDRLRAFSSSLSCIEPEKSRRDELKEIEGRISTRRAFVR